MKHTPGPWRMAASGPNMRDKYGQPFAIAQYGQANLIAGCFGDVQGGKATAEANARLIEAAPDLLEALQWYVKEDDVSEIEGNEFWLEGRERARSAIAKATGE